MNHSMPEQAKMTKPKEKKKKAYMHLQGHHLPGMQQMELGKKYDVHAVIEPTELSTGQDEYLMPDENATPRGRFRIHSITKLDSAPTKKGAAKGGPVGRYKTKKKQNE